MDDRRARIAQDRADEAAAVCSPLTRRDGQCNSSGGTSEESNHECLCVRPDGHQGDEHGCPCGNTWTDPQRPAESSEKRPKASVYAQETMVGTWVWWITSTGNHATLAKSVRGYATEAAALRSAQAVAGLGELEIDERNRR